MELIKQEEITLKHFEHLYRVTGDNMIRLCLMAYALDQEDHKRFWAHATEKMQVSKSTVSAMIRSGKMYTEHNKLLSYEVPYTKVYELSPVIEQVDTYLEDIGGPAKLNDLSQKEIRSSVKEYITAAKEGIDFHPIEKEKPKKKEVYEQLGFKETMNRTECIRILEELIAHYRQNHGLKLDRVDIENLKYVLNEVRKEV